MESIKKIKDLDLEKTTKTKCKNKMWKVGGSDSDSEY